MTSVKESNQDKILFYTHIPKCGGTRFKQILKEMQFEINMLNSTIPPRKNKEKNYLIFEKGNFKKK